MGEQRLGALTVMLRRADTCAHRTAHHQRTGQPPAGTVAQAAGVRHQVLHGGIDEAEELDFHHRFQPLRRHAHGQPGDHGFGQWRVDHPLEAIGVAQAGGGAKYAAIDADILTQHQHVFVLGHGPVQRQVDRLQQTAFDLTHVRLLRRARHARPATHAVRPGPPATAHRHVQAPTTSPVRVSVRSRPPPPAAAPDTR